MKIIRNLLVTFVLSSLFFVSGVSAANTCSEEINRDNYSILSDPIYNVLKKVGNNLYTKYGDDAEKYKALIGVLEKIANNDNYNNSQKAIINFLVEYLSCTVSYVESNISTEQFIENIAGALNGEEGSEAINESELSKSGCKSLEAKDIDLHGFQKKIEFCSDDSRLNGNKKGLYKYDQILHACPEGFHPMERTELDILIDGGSDINKYSLSHWLYDNYYNEQKYYGYEYRDNNMSSVPSSGLMKVRCVKNNDISFNGNSKNELKGCHRVLQTNNGLDYCSESTGLKLDYNASLETEGELIFSNYSDTCSSGYEHPRYAEYYIDNSDFRYTLKSKKVKLQGDKFVYLYTGKLKKGYVVFVTKSSNREINSEYVVLDNLSSSSIAKFEKELNHMIFIVASKKDEWDNWVDQELVNLGTFMNKPDIEGTNGKMFKFSDFFDLKGDLNNQLYLKIDEYDYFGKDFPAHREISGVCVKSGAHTGYLKKASGCSDTIKVGGLEMCSETSRINSCIDGYHELNKEELKLNGSEFFSIKTKQNYLYVNFPFSGSNGTFYDSKKYGFKKPTPTYYVDGLLHYNYNNQANSMGKGSINNNDTYIREVNYNNQGREYFNFYGHKTKGVKVMCVKD